MWQRQWLAAAVCAVALAQAGCGDVAIGARPQADGAAGGPAGSPLSSPEDGLAGSGSHSGGSAGQDGQAPETGPGGQPQPPGGCGCAGDPCTVLLQPGEQCILEDFEAAVAPGVFEHEEPETETTVQFGGQLQISHPTPDASRFLRDLVLEANSAYTVTARMRGVGIAGGVRGASLSVLSPAASTYIEAIDLNCPPPVAEYGSCNGLGDFPWGEVAFSFVADNEGRVTLAAELGGMSWPQVRNFVTGSAQFDDIALRRLGRLADGSVELLYETEDLSVCSPATLQAWVTQLDVAYELWADLVGSRPFAGATQRVVSVAHALADFARSGNPIEYSRHFLRAELARLEAEGGWSFEGLSVLSQNFDIDQRWDWHQGQWAKLKLYYLLQRLEQTPSPARVGPVRVVVDGVSVSSTSELVAHLIARSDSVSPNDADVLLRLLEIAEEVGWQKFTGACQFIASLHVDDYWEMMVTHRDWDRDGDGESDADCLTKFYLFADRLTAAAQQDAEHADFDAVASFSPGELEFLHSHCTEGLHCAW